MLDFLKKAYAAAVDWVERGDLVPLLILVAVPHYITVMVSFEFWPVAVAMGILTDLGHYRTILVYLKSTVGRGAALFWMLILTAISYGFHVGFYVLHGQMADQWPWVVGSVPPILIFAMAYISKREKWYLKKSAPAGGVIASGGAKHDFRSLSEAERAVLKGLSAKEIMQRYPGLSERSASNWKARLK